MDAEFLKILACPKCRGSLAVEGAEHAPEGLSCASCAVVYPVTEGIPVLLAEEAVPRADWERKKS